MRLATLRASARLFHYLCMYSPSGFGIAPLRSTAVYRGRRIRRRASNPPLTRAKSTQPSLALVRIMYRLWQVGCAIQEELLREGYKIEAVVVA